MKRNSKKCFFTIFFRQKLFSPFLKNKTNTKQSLILNFIFGNWSLMYCKRKVHANLKKIYLFKGPVIFCKWKYCRACAVRNIRRFFGIELIKIWPIDSTVMCPFSKITKSENKSTLAFRSFVDKIETKGVRFKI